MKDYNNIGVGLVVSNGCTLSHLAVLESGGTPTRRKARCVGSVLLQLLYTYTVLVF